MSYDTRKNAEGETLIMPIEIPMFDGPNDELGRQAEVCLASFLRHASVSEWINDNLDPRDDATYESLTSENAQAASQLVSLFMTLAGMADNMGIDIMEEIWEMPWEV